MNPTPSPEAVEAAEKIIYLLGVGHVRDIDFTIDRACRAYAARQNAKLRLCLELACDEMEARDLATTEFRAALKQTELP